MNEEIAEEIAKVEATLRGYEDGTVEMTHEELQESTNRWYELIGGERPDILASGNVEIYCHGS